MIHLSGVSKRFMVRDKAIDALLPTDLHVGARQIYGLLGFSGAGKSTLLRVINRLEEPTSGTIRIDGEDITRLQTDELRRAMSA